MNTLDCGFSARLPAHKVFHKARVTPEAVFLKNASVERCHLDGLRKILQGECLGVSVSIQALGKPLACNVRWQVAVHARGD